MTHKVLIVDDEPSIIVSLEFLMQQRGYVLRVARDGDEAMNILDVFQPDLVLLDVMLPGRNGYEICQAIRQEPRLNHTKVILLTAKGRSTDMDKGLAVGADAYVTKPFSIHELTAKVERLLTDEGNFPEA